MLMSAGATMALLGIRVQLEFDVLSLWTAPATSTS